jgi:DNA-binding XRE family transcriptional regulator
MIFGNCVDLHNLIVYYNIEISEVFQMPLYQRVKDVRTILKMSQGAFAEQLGVTRDVVANIESQRVEPQELFIRNLCATFLVNRNWLLTGEGDVFIDKNEDVTEAIRLFHSLNPDFQQYVLQQMKALLEIQNKQDK